MSYKFFCNTSSATCWAIRSSALRLKEHGRAWTEGFSGHLVSSWKNNASAVPEDFDFVRGPELGPTMNFKRPSASPRCGMLRGHLCETHQTPDYLQVSSCRTSQCDQNSDTLTHNSATATGLREGPDPAKFLSIWRPEAKQKGAEICIWSIGLRPTACVFLYFSCSINLSVSVYLSINLSISHTRTCFY